MCNIRYYEGGISSVYLWDLEEGFAAAVLLKKNNEGGTWDSIHVIEVSEREKVARYKITSSIMLQLIVPASSKYPAIDLSGTLTRQVL